MGASVTSLEDSLLQGEKLLWVGAPPRGLMLTGRDILLVPFSILWCGFAIFWEFIAVKMARNTVIFPLWGIPFVVAGLYFVIGRFILDAWLRAGIRYAITDRRILILRPPPFGNLTSLGIERLPELNLSEKANGYGTIYFGPQTTMSGRGGMSGLTPSLSATPQFIGIENARDIFNRIQTLAQRPPP